MKRTEKLKKEGKKLKLKQSKVWFAILALLTIATFALAYQHNIDYQRYVQWYLDQGIDPNILDPLPWQTWGKGPLVALLGFLAGISWLITIVWVAGTVKELTRRHIKLLVILLLIPLVTTIPISGESIYKTADVVETKSDNLLANIAAIPPSDTTVDVLLAGDEELNWLGFMDNPPNDADEIMFIESITNGVANRFSEGVGINLAFHKWASWDSDDGTSSAYYMLQEVIREIGGAWVTDPSWPNGGYWKFNKGMTWNGIVIDMLVAWTYQYIDARGLAPFEWGAAIIRTPPAAPGLASKYEQHEMSHLYGLLHCTHAWCIMNLGYIDLWPGVWWESTCKDYMINHKNYFTRHGLKMNSATGGTTTPSPGTYYYYNGTTVTLTAFPNNGYEFVQWRYDGSSISFNNPWVLIIYSSREVIPVFRENSPPPPLTGGGGGSIPMLR